jgi:hypothetical protein
MQRRIEGRGEKTEQIEVGPALEKLGEVDFLRPGVDRDADADSAELRRHRPADRLVVEVAVVRAVQGDAEASRITRFGKQRLGPLPIGSGSLVARVISAGVLGSATAAAEFRSPATRRTCSEPAAGQV